MTFEDLKEEFNTKVKAEKPCSSEYRRFLETKDEPSLLKVVYDNINWCLDHKVLSHEWLSKFNPDVLLNSGIANTGLENTGFANSGDSNSGNRNSGYSNSGDSNSGYRNSGAFCTEKNPMMVLFNKPTNMTVKEWENSKPCQIMYNIDTTLWIPFYKMTDEEKADHPKAETTDGYLKTIPMKEAWKNAWGNWSDESKDLFKCLPNFYASIFEEITGIKI